jgi:hypothetical protein
MRSRGRNYPSWIGRRGSFKLVRNMGISGIGPTLFGFISGLIVGWIILRRGRRPIQFDVPAIGWVEKPVAIWKQDWTQAVFIWIHALSILSIAVLFLLDRKVPSEILGSSRVTSAALWVVWMIAGSVFSFSFIYPFAGQMPMFVFSNAFARGQYVGGWDCFSHFRTDSKTRMIYLYAALSPEIVRVAWRPTADEVFRDVEGVLKSALPEESPAAIIPWYRRRMALISAILILVLPFLLSAIGVYQSAVSWSWIYYTAAVPLLMVLGTALVRKFEIT